MQYCTSPPSPADRPRLGAVIRDRVVDAAAACASQWPGAAPDSLLALIQAGPPAWTRMRAVLQATTDLPSFAAEAVVWHAPIPRPLKNVFCLGRNYAEHVREGARARGQEAELPKAPVFFTKAPTAVTGPFADVPWHARVSALFDYEAELAVIVGTPGTNLSRDSALNHVFGYTVLNDLTARDLQRSHMQWFKGKSLDDSCPMGPVVVTSDEFGDPQAKRIRLRVNGVTKQDGTTADMIFPVDVTLEWLSQGLTLEPGDIVATGTPDGVGMGRTPPEYLQHDDVVETEIEGIGCMRNRVRRID